MDVKGKLENIAREACEAHNLILVEVRVRGNKQQPIYEVFADSEQGITLGQCEELTRTIQDEMDMDEDFNVNYRLDVSSPGVDRPLVYDYEFKKNRGQMLEVNYDSEGKDESIKGKLIDFDEQIIKIERKKDLVEIPRQSIKKAKVHIQW